MRQVYGATGEVLRRAHVDSAATDDDATGLGSARCYVAPADHPKRHDPGEKYVPTVCVSDASQTRPEMSDIPVTSNSCPASC